MNVTAESTIVDSVADTATALDETAHREFEAILRNTEQPVVMFAYEWCEFCDSVRKVFSKLGITYTAIYLDSAPYQDGDRGSKLFEVLKHHTGSITLPQIFVGGNFEGGCIDVFEILKSGQLQTRLDEYGAIADPSIRMDPYTLLPNWLMPR